MRSLSKIHVSGNASRRSHAGLAVVSHPWRASRPNAKTATGVSLAGSVRIAGMPNSDATAAGSGRSTDSSSVRRAFAILGVFTADRPELGASEVARVLSMPVPTAHRLMVVLADLGYLSRFGRGRFRLGLEAVSLGRRATSSIDLRSALRAELQWLADQTRETAILTVPAEEDAASVCIARVESQHPLRLSLDVGHVTPLNAGASAKALLAFLPAPDIDQLLKRPLESLTPGTITDPDTLARELDEIRRRGYAISIEETDVAAWGVAAPIRSEDGVAVAAFGVVAPLSRYTEARCDEFGKAVKRSATMSERRLGSRLVSGARARPEAKAH